MAFVTLPQTGIATIIAGKQVFLFQREEKDFLERHYNRSLESPIVHPGPLMASQ